MYIIHFQFNCTKWSTYTLLFLCLQTELIFSNILRKISKCLYSVVSVVVAHIVERYPHLKYRIDCQWPALRQSIRVWKQRRLFALLHIDNPVLNRHACMSCRFALNHCSQQFHSHKLRIKTWHETWYQYDLVVWAICNTTVKITSRHVGQLYRLYI